MDPATTQDPDALLSKILSVFGDNRDPTEILRQLLSLKQNPGESVRAYSHRLKRQFDMLVKRQRALEQQPVYTEVLLRDHFWRSVSDSVLSRVLETELHRTPTMSFLDVREAAIRWGRDDHLAPPAAVHHVSTPSPDPTKSNANAGLEALLTTLIDKIDKLAEAKSAPPAKPPAYRSANDHVDSQGRRLCFKCNKPGHLRRQCRQGNFPPPQH